MNVGRSSAGLFACLLLVAAALLGAVGGAAAADVEITNETVAVDNETQSVYTELNATSNVSTNATFDVVYSGIDSEGNVTGELANRSVTVDSGNVTLEEYQSVNASAYESVRVTVKVNNSSVSPSNVSAEVGTIQKVAGSSGGGFDLGGTDGATAGIALVALLGLFVLMGDD